MRLQKENKRTWLWHEERPVVREGVSETDEEPEGDGREEPRLPAWLIRLLVPASEV